MVKKDAANRPEAPVEPTAVTVAEQGGELVSNVLDFADMQADAGEGREDIGIKDIALPYLTVLQSNSPQVTEGDSKYIDGARAGMIFNTVTHKLTPGKEGVLVIRCAYQMEIVEWKPRGNGGGLAGRHPITSNILSKAKPNEQGKPTLESGNTLEETAYHYVLEPLEDGQMNQAVVTMKSTQLKYSKRWNTALNTAKATGANGAVFNPPHYAQVYRLVTRPDKNSKGAFFSWAAGVAAQGPGEFLSEGLLTDKRHYEAAKAYREAVTSGLLRAAVQTDEAGASNNPDDVPF